VNEHPIATTRRTPLVRSRGTEAGHMRAPRSSNRLPSVPDPGGTLHPSSGSNDDSEKAPPSTSTISR